MDKQIFGLIGEHLLHSHSPKIHSLFGCEDYSLYELKKDELSDFLSKNIGGVNVTIPYKIDALSLCDTLSQNAKEIGSVNTIVKKDSKLYGYNTDADGFAYMVNRAQVEFKDKKILILGSGGACKTVFYVSKKIGAREVLIISRSGENNYENISRHYDAEIIVNTTPVGMFPNCEKSPLDLAPFTKLCAVFDLIYNPLRTRLILQAKELGIKCAGGLDMLVYQAKRAEEIFFDIPIDEESTQNVLKKISQDCENIVLIGMPGCGKTTVGKKLSALCGRELYDTDEMICKLAGKSIPEIFAQNGEEYFRALEMQAVAEAGKRSGVIITTGGGAVTKKENYASLAQNGKIYRIVRDVSLLETADRPLSKDKDTLIKLAEQREEMYSYFEDARVSNNTSPEKCAQEIWRDFCENSGN